MKRGSETRDRLLEAAERLFYKCGVESVGVDRISAEAGVGKMTLYRHFPSKNDLVLAYLERRDQRWRHEFTQAITTGATGSRERIGQLFERMATWFASSDFFGCAFINADAGRVDARSAALIRQHKTMMRELIGTQVRSLDVADPESLTEQIFLLTEGAIVTARLTGSNASADTARTAALTLIDAAMAGARVSGSHVP